MARKASVRYWTSRGAYCCWHNKSQLTLAVGPDDKPDGPTYKAALSAFARLSCPDVALMPLSELVAKYVEWLTIHRKLRTAEIRQERLKPVCDVFGSTPIANLTAYDLETWCDKQRLSRQWVDGTVKITLLSVRACLRWGEAKGVIPKNPIKKFDMPTDVSRSADCVLTPEQVQTVVGSTKGPVRVFVQFLRDTGCRPGEAAMAESRHYDSSLRAIVIPAVARRGETTHKTSRSKKPRVIYLRGESVAAVERLCKLHPTGPLFRTGALKRGGQHKGKNWGWTTHGVVMMFTNLRHKTGIQGLIAYSFRHTFAVRWLREGKSSDALAEILGTSPEMIRRHYGHLAEQHDYLRRLVDEFDPQGHG